MTNANDLLTPACERVRSPALLSLFLSLAACLPAMAVLALGGPTLLAVGTQAITAFLTSRWLGLPAWWQLINLVFGPLLWFAYGIDIAPAWFLIGFILLAATSLGTLRSRVPLYFSSNQAVEEIVRRLPDRAGVAFIDLGCGLGGLLRGLAKARPGIKLHGVEIAPFNWLVARLALSRRARVRLGSLWREDLSRYQVVYAYLSPAPMARLWQKVVNEMRPGSLFISNSFAVPGVPPDETVELHDLNNSRLLIWRR